MVGCVLGGPPELGTELRCSLPRALFSEREIKEIGVRRCEFWELLVTYSDVDLYDVRGFLLLERSVREVRRRRFKALQTRLGRPIMDERACYEEYELKRKQKQQERRMYYQKRRELAVDKGKKVSVSCSDNGVDDDHQVRGKQKLMDGAEASDNAAGHHQEKKRSASSSSDVVVDDDEAGGKRIKRMTKKKTVLEVLEAELFGEERESDGDVSPIREEAYYRDVETKYFFGPYS